MVSCIPNRRVGGLSGSAVFLLCCRPTPLFHGSAAVLPCYFPALLPSHPAVSWLFCRLALLFPGFAAVLPCCFPALLPSRPAVSWLCRRPTPLLPGSSAVSPRCFPALLSSCRRPAPLFPGSAAVLHNHSKNALAAISAVPISSNTSISPRAYSRFFDRTHCLRRSCGWRPVFSFCGTFPIMPQPPDLCRDTPELCREVPYKPVYFGESTTSPRSTHTRPLHLRL